MPDCLKKDWFDTLLPIWPVPGSAPVAGRNAGVILFQGSGLKSLEDLEDEDGWCQIA